MAMKENRSMDAVDAATKAALAASNNAPLKTPISFLQEFCARMGITPKYDLLSIEGAVHEPTFVYRVTVGEITASGTGQSKKKAKHGAAKSVLETLLAAHGASMSTAATIVLNVGHPEDNNDASPTENINTTQILSPYDDGIPGNPVGALQELCMSRRWPPPSYDVIEEDGLPHERTFIMCCSVKKHEQRGAGKSKKLAKRQAANKMLQVLKDMPTRQENLNVLDDDEEERCPGLRDSRIPTMTPSIAHKVSQFYRNLRAAPGDNLNLLHKISLSEWHEHDILLQGIGKDHGFEVTFVDIEEMSKSAGHYQCLVQLSTLPVAVCPGSGKTARDAQNDAAKNALEYLKIMTRS